MPRYKHSQPGWVIIASFVAILMLILLVPGKKPDENGMKVAGTIIAVCLALFYKLTVVLDDNLVVIKFGYGVIRMKYALSDIAAVAVVKNKWWYGWGIRYLGTGWLYNVSGLDAVEIKLKNGKIHRIGTDEPLELEKALKESIKG